MSLRLVHIALYWLVTAMTSRKELNKPQGSFFSRKYSQYLYKSCTFEKKAYSRLLFIIHISNCNPNMLKLNSRFYVSSTWGHLHSNSDEDSAKIKINQCHCMAYRWKIIWSLALMCQTRGDAAQCFFRAGTSVLQFLQSLASVQKFSFVCSTEANHRLSAPLKFQVSIL